MGDLKHYAGVLNEIINNTYNQRFLIKFHPSETIIEKKKILEYIDAASEIEVIEDVAPVEFLINKYRIKNIITVHSTAGINLIKAGYKVIFLNKLFNQMLAVDNGNCAIDQIIDVYTKNNFDKVIQVIECLNSTETEMCLNKDGDSLEEIYDEI
jgi:hypothetical protein